MLILVTGGSGSGKSEFAENLAVSFQKKPLIYIATMIPFDEETKRKISRHQSMRESKEFTTMECFTDLDCLSGMEHSVVLLECLSNLLANEMYKNEEAKDHPVEKVMKGIMNVKSQAEHMVVVSNEVFSDGVSYDRETTQYIKCLGNINKKLAEIADQVIEVVYSIPIYYKGTRLQ